MDRAPTPKEAAWWAVPAAQEEHVRMRRSPGDPVGVLTPWCVACSKWATGYHCWSPAHAKRIAASDVAQREARELLCDPAVHWRVVEAYDKVTWCYACWCFADASHLRGKKHAKAWAQVCRHPGATRSEQLQSYFNAVTKSYFQLEEEFPIELLTMPSERNRRQEDSKETPHSTPSERTQSGACATLKGGCEASWTQEREEEATPGVAQSVGEETSSDSGTRRGGTETSWGGPNDWNIPSTWGVPESCNAANTWGATVRGALHEPTSGSGGRLDETAGAPGSPQDRRFSC